MTGEPGRKFPSSIETDEEARAEFIEKTWFTTPHPVSLELLVKTAATLSPNYESFSGAAEAALRLIDTCARLLERNRSHAELVKQELEIYAALGVEPGEDIPFPLGVKYATGQARAERAEEDFITYLKAEGRDRYPDQATEYAAERLAQFEREGFSVELLQIARQLFEKYRESGALEKRRRTAKKDLEAKTAGPDASKTDKPASKRADPAK
jgi:hypothetical protein